MYGDQKNFNPHMISDIMLLIEICVVTKKIWLSQDWRLKVFCHHTNDDRKDSITIGLGIKF
jgi:hypothetical protein